LTVLAEDPTSQALTFAEIVRNTAKLVRKKRTAGEDTELISTSETVLAQRVPLLLKDGFVARPLGRNGMPTKRKGIGITPKGRELLKKPLG
jgi:hypothetical protein